MVSTKYHHSWYSLMKEKPQWGSTGGLYGGQQQYLQAFSRPTSPKQAPNPSPSPSLVLIYKLVKHTDSPGTCLPAVPTTCNLLPLDFHIPSPSLPWVSLCYNVILSDHFLHATLVLGGTPLISLPVMYLRPGIRQQLYLLIIHEERFYFIHC